MEGEGFFLRGLHPLGEPTLEFLDRVAANGKLDEMKRHEKRLEHDPEKWKPVFRKNHAQEKIPLGPDSTPVESDPNNPPLLKSIIHCSLPLLPALRPPLLR